MLPGNETICFDQGSISEGFPLLWSKVYHTKFARLTAGQSKSESYFPTLTKLFLLAVTEKSGTKRSVQLLFVCFNFTGHTPGMFLSKLQLKLTKNKKLVFLTNSSCLKIFSRKRFRFTFVTVCLSWILNAIAIWTFFDLVSVSLRSPRKTYFKVSSILESSLFFYL